MIEGNGLHLANLLAKIIQSETFLEEQRKALTKLNNFIPEIVFFFLKNYKIYHMLHKDELIKISNLQTNFLTEQLE